MVEANKNQRAEALKEAKHLYKDICFTAGILKAPLTEDRKTK